MCINAEIVTNTTVIYNRYTVHTTQQFIYTFFIIYFTFSRHLINTAKSTQRKSLESDLHNVRRPFDVPQTIGRFYPRVAMNLSDKNDHTSFPMAIATAQLAAILIRVTFEWAISFGAFVRGNDRRGQALEDNKVTVKTSYTISKAYMRCVRVVPYYFFG